MTRTATVTAAALTAITMTVAVASLALTATAAPPNAMPASAPTPARRAGCPAAAPTAGQGIVDPFHVPSSVAAQQNADGKIFYRQGRWEDARQKYRAALASDPDFLAPALNIACSFVRQEHFSQAMTQVLSLIDHAYLPWSHEVLSAADLGALKIRAEGKQLQAALDAARLRWAQGLSTDLILIARVRPPLKLGDTPGAAGTTAPRALVLGQRQEVFAWSPWTRRYRQLTSEDGRVLAVNRSSDGRRISYVTAEKLIRYPGGKPQQDSSLRGVVINEMDLGTLVSLGHASIQGDVRVVDILNVGSIFIYRIERSPGSAATFVLSDDKLEVRAASRTVRPAVSLTGAGVAASGGTTALEGGCAATARDRLATDGAPPYVSVTPSSSPGAHPPEVLLGATYGAGLAGLPIP